VNMKTRQIYLFTYFEVWYRWSNC